jgi:hypothetical protein
MKSMILVLSLLGFVRSNLYSQEIKDLTRNERSFVKNVIKIQNEKPVEVTKRVDNHIVIEFNYTMVVLKPNGFIDKIWIRTDGDWLSLETAEKIY